MSPEVKEFCKERYPDALELNCNDFVEKFLTADILYEFTQWKLDKDSIKIESIAE